MLINIPQGVRGTRSPPALVFLDERYSAKRTQGAVCGYRVLLLYILGERERQTASRIKKLRAFALLFALSSKHAFEIVDSGSERIGGRRLRV